MFFRSLLQASALLPFLSATTSAQSSTACNNSPSLCSRAYNNITHLGAHDSPFLRDKSTSFSTSGNQYYNSTVQLDAGVRLLSAQVHKNGTTSNADKWRLCHSTCDLLDAGNLADWLSEIKTWMDNNENEVVTVLLVNSDDASASDLGPQFTSSGIDKYAYTPPSPSTVPTTWPTLDSLISNGTRLMAFVASLSEPSAQYPYLMDEFTFIFENDFENESPTNYSCTPDRPRGLTTSSTGGRMFFMNHFLYSTQLFGIQQPNDTYVNVTNAETGLGSLGTRIDNCTSVYSKAPTFVLVDFFNVGPAMASVDRANGVSRAVGRKSVTTAQPSEAEQNGDASPAMRRDGSIIAVVVAVMVAIAFGL
ncbi:hypothetical protein BU23DRAFT_553835 [Bimuria novae-zelandiae CBS 107.79]|uniref:PLC-like phosphodiesterase n=1 Tax=Bimuria novae-zelandiae CBS 107.79 TaxID=1447943 RepID=A0A6A5VBX3_9PLEO|nr:hypothetical protein BU23DRAFT_553835 [Bimuria novae-zelandiae CBS 107.79]